MRENLRKIIVTGASGFLGRHLVKRLQREKDVMIFALSSQLQVICGFAGEKDVVPLQKDVIFTIEGRDILEDAIVIQCAYPRNTMGGEVADGLRYIQAVFEKSVEAGAVGIVNVSSQSVYAQTRMDVATEEDPVCLENAYAVGKYAMELLLESICKNSDTSFTNVRLASLIGPGFNQRIVNRFVKSAVQHDPIRVEKSHQRFGFTDVLDAAEGLSSLALCDTSDWDTVYNLGVGYGYTLEEIVETIRGVFSENGEDFSLVEYLPNNGKSGTTAVSYQRLQGCTGFIPRITLKESVRRIRESFLGETV